jgi:hypothetical protein
MVESQLHNSSVGDLVPAFGAVRHSSAKRTEAQGHEWEVFDELFTTRRTTVAGMAALLDCLAIKPYDPEDETSARPALGISEREAADA